MRIWSIHPVYLDQLGLVALWRECLLAQQVLLGRTTGYKKHPQLLRFQQQHDPLAFLANYLHVICNTADALGYKFAREKITLPFEVSLDHIVVTRGQIAYEWQHFLRKAEMRSRHKFLLLKELKDIKEHPSFCVIDGDIAAWEKNVNSTAVTLVISQQVD